LAAGNAFQTNGNPEVTPRLNSLLVFPIDIVRDDWTDFGRTKPPTLPPKSKMELTSELAVQASTELDELCVAECNVEFALVPFDGNALKQLTDQSGAMSDEDMVTWVTHNAPSGLFQQKHVKLVTFLLEERKAMREFQKSIDDILKEDLGWPHRMSVYYDRCTGQSSKRRKRDPQRWFMDRSGDGIRGIQEGSDPDRYVPNTPREKLTVVGKVMQHQLRFETTLDATTTVGSLKEEIAGPCGFDPNHSLLGFHNRSLHDKDLNLMNFGILPGTILHFTPGWATVEATEQAMASWESGENAFVNT
jgi:hypothetical protein